MRNMSFALTTDQIRSRTKTVTRRLGWTFLKPDESIRAVVKTQGLKRGEKVEPLAVLRVKSVQFEALSAFSAFPGYGAAECEREGFPHLSPTEFVAMFRRKNRCKPEDIVTRIEFEYVDEEK